jgi:protocatechuate 3,4-dioxygenase beta subunit
MKKQNSINFENKNQRDATSKIQRDTTSKSTSTQNGRRQFLAGMGLVGLGLSADLKSLPLAICKEGLTPVQPEGPFYPVHDQLDKDNDLTQVRGDAGVAKGQVIYVRGKVLSVDCAPIQNALVEIWQACESGRYNHPGDTENPALLDDHFQYWGQCVTNANGEYVFKTIIPGSYPAGENWIRPPHIHFKISRRGFHEFITQMYFAGQALNEKDLIFKALSKADQAKVVVSLQPPSDEFEPNSKIATFDLVLNKVE